MHSGLSVLFLAIAASLTHAVPTPTRPLEKRSFKVPVKGHKKVSPAHAMAHAYRKYGWDISKLDPQQALDGFFHHHGNQASSAVPWWEAPASSVVIIIESSGFASFPSASASAIISSAPFSASAVPSSQPLPISSGVPSASGPVSSAAGPSSSAAASAPPPSSSAPSSGGGSNEGEVTASPEQNDAAYLAPVSIGGQKLNLDFDTGSSDMWVFNTLMPSSETSGHSVYDPSKSSTFTKDNGATWQIQYGDGSTASGSVGFDTVNIGGVVASKQCVELAEQVSGSFLQDTQSDGLLGLAFSSINQVRPQPQKTFFENVMNQLDQPLFTADLKDGATGTYEFGAIDSSKYTGTINYAPVDNSQGFWQFTSKTYTVGGTQHSCTTCSPTIADTGTSLLIFDDDVVQAYYQQVQGAQSTQQGYVYPCSSTLPDFGVAIGNGFATVKGSDMTYMQAGGGQCFGGIQPNGGNGINIVGDVLLKQFFAVFDGGNLRFGLAAQA